MFLSKLTLGTAQLGLNYGVANTSGKPDFNTSLRILQYSWDNGINAFDTAPSYGNSEKIINSFISSNISNNLESLVIISKLPKVEDKSDLKFDHLYTIIKKTIIQSLNTLKIDKFPFYLIHHAPDIFLKDGIIVECLHQIKKEGLIDRIGVSIYKPEEAEASLKFREIDVIQVPINMFDHRLIKTGLLKKLKEKKYTIFARSIYLQGLFFKSTKNLPRNLEIAKNFLLRLQRLSTEHKIDIAKLALLFIRDRPEIDSIIIGAEKVEQVADNINILKEKPLDHDLQQQIFEEFSDISEKIINPSLWNKETKQN